ncbi:MAG: hypothetical protein ACREUW_09090 [Burkholderiales bacterium]
MSAAAKGILFSQMVPPAELEAEFNDWYETEHIPVRLALPGFSGATRYLGIDGERNYLAIYEISDLKVLDTPEYQALKTRPSERTKRMLNTVQGFTRFTCVQTFEQGGGRGDVLSAVAFQVPTAAKAALDDWYEAEHVPLLLRAPDWLRVRRFEVLSSDGGPWTHFALHELRSVSVMDSPERKAACEGPKRKALAGQDWFEQSGRWLYRVVSRFGSSRSGGQ